MYSSEYRKAKIIIIILVEKCVIEIMLFHSLYIVPYYRIIN